MDLYFIKVRARSKGTAEEIVGYFFGKTNSAPDFDFLVVPLRYSEIIDDITLEENLGDFKEKLEKARQEIKGIGNTYDVTVAFLAYLNNMLNRRGKIPLGIEFSTAIKEGDTEVLKVIISDLLEEWSPKMEVFVKAEGMLLEEYSAYTFLEMQEDFTDENISKTYSRADIADLPEVFPVIDPINGTSIVQFDIGDTIPVVILNAGKYEKVLREKFPNFDQDKVSVEAKIISKELIRVKGGNLYLVKVELADDLIAKSLISPALKILSDESYFMKKKRQQRSNERNESGEKYPKTIKVEIPSTTGSELLISFMTTLLVTGALLIIIYLFMK